eukprot:scaffold8694_cov101-Isochrysis_galbana.AAC.7
MRAVEESQPHGRVLSVATRAPIAQRTLVDGTPALRPDVSPRSRARRWTKKRYLEAGGGAARHLTSRSQARSGVLSVPNRRTSACATFTQQRGPRLRCNRRLIRPGVCCGCGPRVPQIGRPHRGLLSNRARLLGHQSCGYPRNRSWRRSRLRRPRLRLRLRLLRLRLAAAAAEATRPMASAAASCTFAEAACHCSIDSGRRCSRPHTGPVGSASDWSPGASAYRAVTAATAAATAAAVLGDAVSWPEMAAAARSARPGCTSTAARATAARASAAATGVFPCTVVVVTAGEASGGAAAGAPERALQIEGPGGHWAHVRRPSRSPIGGGAGCSDCWGCSESGARRSSCAAPSAAAGAETRCVPP